VKFSTHTLQAAKNNSGAPAMPTIAKTTTTRFQSPSSELQLLSSFPSPLPIHCYSLPAPQHPLALPDQKSKHKKAAPGSITPVRPTIVFSYNFSLLVRCNPTHAHHRQPKQQRRPGSIHHRQDHTIPATAT
jgi:hypothetical protein